MEKAIIPSVVREQPMTIVYIPEGILGLGKLYGKLKNNLMPKKGWRLNVMPERPSPKIFDSSNYAEIIKNLHVNMPEIEFERLSGV